MQWDHQNNRSKGFGFVDFSTPDEAAKAVAELNGKEIDGRAVKVDIAAGRDDSNKQKTDRRANAFGDKESEPADTLFVGNLPFSANEDSVYELFAQHGDVQSVRLPTDRETGAPKGFGYVSFSSLEQAKAAMEALSVSQCSLLLRVMFFCYHYVGPLWEEEQGRMQGKVIVRELDSPGQEAGADGALSVLFEGMRGKGDDIPLIFASILYIPFESSEQR